MVDAWREQRLHRPTKEKRIAAHAFSYFYDENIIRRGRRILVARNPILGVVLALHYSALDAPDAYDKIVLSLSLEKPERAVISSSPDGPYRRILEPSVAPYPAIRLNSLQDPALQTCDWATLQPLVMKDSSERMVRTLELLDMSSKRNDQTDNLVRTYQSDRRYLSRAGLEVPQHLAIRYDAYRAKMRILGYPLPEDTGL